MIVEEGVPVRIKSVIVEISVLTISFFGILVGTEETQRKTWKLMSAP